MAWRAEEGNPISEKFKQLVVELKRYAPHWDGVPLTPAQSVSVMMGVIERVGPEDSGAFLSHLGTRKWL